MIAVRRTTGPNPASPSSIASCIQAEIKETTFEMHLTGK